VRGLEGPLMNELLVVIALITKLDASRWPLKITTGGSVYRASFFPAFTVPCVYWACTP
jgi:hypothetical protein